MQNLIHFQTVTNSDGEFVCQPHEKLKNKKNLIPADKFADQKIKIFRTKNSSREQNKKKEEMQNWILLQTVTSSDGEFGSQRQKKLKNKKI